MSSSRFDICDFTLLAAAFTLGLASNMKSLWDCALASIMACSSFSSSLLRFPLLPTMGWLQRVIVAWLSGWIHDNTFRKSRAICVVSRFIQDTQFSSNGKNCTNGSGIVTYWNATLGPKGWYPLKLLIWDGYRNNKSGGVCITKLVMVIYFRYPPTFVRQSLEQKKQLNPLTKSDNGSQCSHLLGSLSTEVAHLPFIFGQGIIHLPTILRENLVILKSKARLKNTKRENTHFRQTNRQVKRVAEQHALHMLTNCSRHRILNTKAFEFSQNKSLLKYLNV